MKKKAIKRLFYKIHTWIGIKLSILFFIVCFSGTLATLSHEMDWLFIPEMRVQPQAELAPRKPIIDALKRQYPDVRIENWRKLKEPYLCDIIRIKDKNQHKTYVFVNPYTGKIQGSTALTFHRYFRNLHYYLYLPFQIGHYTVLLFAFLLFFSLVTALYFYKNWWRKLFILRVDKGPIFFFRSLHRLVGLWSIPFTILFSVTGMWYFAERANIGNLSKVVNPDAPRLSITPPNLDKTTNMSLSIDYDKVVANAKKIMPSLQEQTISIKPAKTPKHTVFVRGKSDVSLVRQRANRIYINPHTYDVVKIQHANDISAIMWLNDIADPLHFGYWGGLTTKIIWFILGLGICYLIGSGIWLSLQQRALRRKRQIKRFSWSLFSNWLVVGIMLIFMYQNLITSYQVSSKILVVVSTGWLIFIGFIYYIFVYRLNQKINKES